MYKITLNNKKPHQSILYLKNAGAFKMRFFMYFKLPEKNTLKEPVGRFHTQHLAFSVMYFLAFLAFFFLPKKQQLDELKSLK